MDALWRCGHLQCGFSYTIEHEDSTQRDSYTRTSPSGPAYRTTLRVLRDFMSGLDLVHMQPTSDWVEPPLPALRSGALGAWPPLQCIQRRDANHTAECAAFVNNTRAVRQLRVLLPTSAVCVVEWVDVAKGATVQATVPAPSTPTGWRIIDVPLIRWGLGLALGCRIECACADAHDDPRGRGRAVRVRR